MQQCKQPSPFIVLMVAALVCVSDAQPVGAQRDADSRLNEVAATTEPLMAVVSLNNQRVAIYAGANRVLQATVSSGRKDYETPAGIYSIIEKNREHYSNLYDDAAMPFMQRLTWSGIALHAGALPGYPASHGCIRMPYEFAEQLFDLSKIGMRVVVVRDDIAPVPIAHSRLFKPGPILSDASIAPVAYRPTGDTVPGRIVGVGTDQTWRSIAAAKTAAAGLAAVGAEVAAKAASKARAEAAPFVRKMRIAEGAKFRAEALVRQAERAMEAAESPEATAAAEELKSNALERLANAQKDLASVTAEGQPKVDVATAAREAARAAEIAKVAAYDDAKAAETKLAPVSVFISRKTQRLYVRQGFQPVFESPLTISDAEEPIGTTMFTAVAYVNEGTDLRWTALAMYAPAGANDQPLLRRHAQRNVGPAKTDIDTAKRVLERIFIPQDAIDRISEIVSPRSALIISDEVMSRETSKGTDFIVIMSGEPQGGIKMRRRNLDASYRSYRPQRPRSYSETNPFAWW